MPPSKVPFWKWPTGFRPSKVRSHLIQQCPPAHARHPTQAERNARFNIRLFPYAYPKHFHDWDWPADPRIPPSKLSSPEAPASPAADMGRSGYDTTNMKMAKNPRPAASDSPKPKSTADEKKKQPAPPSQENGQDQGCPCPKYVFPQPGDEEAEKKMPIPRLEGRGWTFWL